MNPIIWLEEFIGFFRPLAQRRMKLIMTVTSLVCAVWLLGLGPGVPGAQAQAGCAGVTQVPASECEALVALYTSANGPGWTNSTNWLAFDANAPCNWFGVTCSSNHITSLSLISNNLTGTIPPELGNLTSLEFLTLSNTQLSGSIPAE